MKSLLSFAFLLVFCVSVSAQGFGIRAGANVANLTGDIEDNASIVSWQFGGFFDLGLTETTDLNIAALYSKKGAKDENSDMTNDLSYLEIPVLLRFEVIPPLFLQGGVYGSYLLGADFGDQDVKEFFSNGDYGIQFGAGIALSQLRFDARYSYGLSDINDISVESVRNSVITIGAELSF